MRFRRSCCRPVPCGFLCLCSAPSLVPAPRPTWRAPARSAPRCDRRAKQAASRCSPHPRTAPRRQVEVLFVLQRLAGRTIGDPVLLILVQLLDRFDDQHQETEHRRHPFELWLRDRKYRHERYQSGDDHLSELQDLVAALGSLALSVVRADLILQAIQGWGALLHPRPWA